MKLRTYKRKKTICRILKEVFVAVGICGVVMIIAACDGLTENIINLMNGIRQILRGSGLILIAYITYYVMDYIEHWTSITKK